MDARLWRQIDIVLMLAMASLISVGLVLIYSASKTGSASEGMWFDNPTTRQALYALFGLVVLVGIAFFDYKLLGRLAPSLYLIMIGSLVGVLVFGRSIYGAKRWIDLPLGQFQPSEMAKLVLIITLAKFFSDRSNRSKSPGTFLLSLLLVVPPISLVFLQPDMGTIIVILSIWFGIAVMAGINYRYLFGLIGIGLLALPKIYDLILHSYMRDRIEDFLNPNRDPLGTGYNVIQAEISVGSGGLLGKGFLQGTQTQLNYLRVQSTDFIFSVLGEEFGFLGALMLFALFVVLLYRALDLAGTAKDSFGRLIIVGVVVTLLVQTFINIGVNIRLLPVTGIPLPFVSYGGTALLTFMVALGLVQSIAARQSRG